MPISKHEDDGPPVTSDVEISNRLKDFLEKRLGCKTIVDAAKKLGVPRSTLDRWTKGDWISRDGLTALAMHHCNLHWLLTGWGEERIPVHPDYFSNLEFAHEMAVQERDEMHDHMNDAVKGGVVPKPIVVTQLFEKEWPVRGLAAADDSGGRLAPIDDDFGGSITQPPGMMFVPVRGDSMSPVVLPGQYVAIDQDREGFEVDGGIVVAYIEEPSAEDERREPMTGTFVKRCYKGDGVFYFTSANDYPPFSAWEDHCRIWPVIGVWFADRGKPPTEG